MMAWFAGVTKAVFTMAVLVSVRGAAAADQAAPTCATYECPEFETTFKGRDFEIRRYSAGTLWVSTTPLSVDHSFRESTRAGFHRLFGYVKGNNTAQKEMPMTAPAVTDVAMECTSDFAVRLLVPRDVRADPPSPLPTESLIFKKYAGGWCAAVRSFGGFATDENIVEESASLRKSLSDTPWANALRRRNCSAETQEFSVAQYNAPFEEESRVNEIWFLWDIVNSTLC